ncbi:MAG TPA: VOC family protein, partial [Paracoccaceae bacterium]|nr:VOC family protein [Paracoccaceae bacterium]
MWRLDHLAVTARDLDAGAAAVEALMGVAPSAGGQHAAMATHNRLWSLGDVYLEVIAPDPAAVPPGRPRWFRLDERAGRPALTNWVAACDDLDAALARAPAGAGVATDLARGDLRWRMGVPDDGRLPFGDAFPALIEWQGAAHPRDLLPDRGLRLRRLVGTFGWIAAGFVVGWA